MKTHILYRSGCAHRVRGTVGNDPHRSGGGRKGPRDHPRLASDCGFLKANDPDDPSDQGSNPTFTGAGMKYGLTVTMAVPGKSTDCEACGGLVGELGQSNDHLEV